MDLTDTPVATAHTLAVEELERSLSTNSQTGLTAAEAKDRLARFGPNKLPEPERISAIGLFVRQFANFMVAVLLGAIVVSLAVGDTKDAIVIGAIVIINAIVGFVQEHKAERALESLKRMASPQATVLRDGDVEAVPTETVAQGDIVLLEEGDIVPADIRLVEEVGLEANEAMLTGEAAAALKHVDTLPDGNLPIGERRNMAYMGTIINVGHARGIVVATGAATQMGRIAETLAIPLEKPTPLQIKLAGLGRTLVVLTIVLCGAIGLIGNLQGRGAQEMAMTAISLAVAIIPEGLVVVVTVTMAVGVQRMARRRAIVRNLHAVEVLGSVTVICSDKTGTLTEGRMSVTEIFANGRRYQLANDAPPGTGALLHLNRPVNDFEPPVVWLLRTAALCNSAVLQQDEAGRWEALGDSTDAALQLMAAQVGHDKPHLLQKGWQVLDGAPFDSDRKRMSMICVSPDNQPFVLVKGAAEAIFSVTTSTMDGQGEAGSIGSLRQASHDFADAGLRVLAFAYRPLENAEVEPTPEELERDLICVGLVGISDPPRPEARQAVARCSEAGIKVIMVTGDHRATAVNIARQLGIVADDHERVISGSEMDAMTPVELATLAPELNVVARVSPQNKLTLVQALRQQGEVVAMTGDGVNDAPAIKHANVGVAMGISGTDVTKQAADIILSDDNFATIVTAVEEGRRIFDNIVKFIVFLLTINAAQLFVILFAIVGGLPVPFTPIQNLWLNIVTGTPPALALGFSPAVDGLMQRRPRRPYEPILGWWNSGTILFHGLLMSIMALGMFLVEVYVDHEPIDKARTATFTMLATLQLIYAFNVVGEPGPAAFRSLGRYRWLVGAVLLSLALLLIGIYFPVLSDVFGQDELYLQDWGEILGGVVLFLVCAEVFRRLRNRLRSEQPSEVTEEQRSETSDGI
ncbi:MAG TPA: cation-transporting P-type ATPase [Gemmatales bacterium]|nr:cation-transporting P-type ATPase [Gemmatales bacterium]HMP58740.1 cation-transporting P-type ATPase [Gemmatales bacterium]